MEVDLDDFWNVDSDEEGVIRTTESSGVSKKSTPATSSSISSGRTKRVRSPSPSTGESEFSEDEDRWSVSSPRSHSASSSEDSGDESSDLEEFEEFFDGFDEELFGDEEDRARLMGMTELEREEIIFDRYERREKLRADWERRRAMWERKRAAKEQRRKEAEQRRKDRKRRKADSRQTVSRKKNSSKDKKLIRVRNRDSVRDSRGEQFSRSMNEISITDRDEDFGKPFVSDRDLRQEETLDELGMKDVVRDRCKILFLTRDQVALAIEEPYFERMIMKSFVRILLGEQRDRRVYRLCRVIGIAEKEESRFKLQATPRGHKEPRTIHTNRALRLRFGGAQRTFSIERLSNTVFSDSEFDFWFKEACQYDSIDIPSKDEVDEKNETLLAISRYRYTEEETSNMLTRRKMLRPEAKISQRRIELRQALQASLSSEQEDEVLRIRKELELIEASLSHSNEVEVTPKTPSSSTPRTKSASVGLDVPSVLALNIGQGDEKDPFSRRETVSRDYFFSGSSDGVVESNRSHDLDHGGRHRNLSEYILDRTPASNNKFGLSHHALAFVLPHIMLQQPRIRYTFGTSAEDKTKSIVPQSQRAAKLVSAFEQLS